MDVHHLFDYLAWDSDFFGFQVGRILVSSLLPYELEQVLQEMRSSGCRLAYWFVEPENRAVGEVATQHGGVLVDHKVTYVTELDDSVSELCLPGGYALASYPGPVADEQIKTLALQSGEYSRFRVDPRFPKQLFHGLYSRWIERSVSREIARDVLVAKEAGVLLGLITVGEKSGRGDIGLVAVDEAARGRGVGKALVHSSLQWFSHNGYFRAQVVTQAANTGACRLYESCGFRLETTKDVYHFWL